MDLPAHLRAVKMARAAALASFLGLVIAWVGPFLVVVALGIGLHVRGLHIGNGALTTGGLTDILTVIVLGAALAFVSVLLYIVAFYQLRKLGPGFGGPMALTIIGVLGLLLVVLGLALLLVDFFNAIAACNGTVTSNCFDIYTTVGPVYAVFFGFILAFIGWIGLLIGIFRIGSRYGSTLTKVGAILMIIPVIGIIAPILVLVGIQGIVHTLRTRSGAPA